MPSLAFYGRARLTAQCLEPALGLAIVMKRRGQCDYGGTAGFVWVEETEEGDYKMSVPIAF